MIIVDTHIHPGQTWYEPVETILFHMKQNGVAKTVLIQSNGNYDNNYEIECVKKYPGKFAAAVWVDAKKEDAPATLEKWAEMGATGIRIQPSVRSPGPDPLAIWRKISELGLAISMSGGRGLEANASEDFVRLIEKFPNIKMVLEHLGGVGLVAGAGAGVPQEMDWKAWDKILALSKYPNVYLKLCPFGEFVQKPNLPHYEGPPRECPREIRMAYDAFGAKHMMWGSDFPRVSGREGYTNALRIPMERISFFTQEDKEWVFGKTALSVWFPK